jgi:prophage regulatory protein
MSSLTNSSTERRRCLRGSERKDATTVPTETAERLLPLPAVIDRTSLGRSAIYDKMNRGEFPKAIRISENRVAWSERAVAAWIATKMATA